jgi:hypothetical protein
MTLRALLPKAGSAPSRTRRLDTAGPWSIGARCQHGIGEPLAQAAWSVSLHLDHRGFRLSVVEEVAAVSLRRKAAVHRLLLRSLLWRASQDRSACVTDTSGRGEALRPLVIGSAGLLDEHVDRLQAISRAARDGTAAAATSLDDAVSGGSLASRSAVLARDAIPCLTAEKVANVEVVKTCHRTQGKRSAVANFVSAGCQQQDHTSPSQAGR